MAAHDHLTRFVHDALAAGQPRDAIAAALQQAGWPAREIDAALSTYAELPFPTPVPRPVPTLAPRHLFLFAVLFIAMGTSAVNMVTLLHGLIDLWLTDLAFDAPAAWTARTIRWSVAALAVATPIYILMSRHVARAAAADAGILASPLRKWLTYLALLASALVFLGDAIYTLDRFLRGELELRFALKALAVAVVSGAVFLHYLRDAERSTPGPDRHLAVVGVTVAATMALALVAIGGPQAARNELLDLARYAELDQLTRALECNLREAPADRILPEALSVESLLSYCPGREVWTDTLTDDETGAPYRYERLDDARFRVCGSFHDASVIADNRQRPHEGFDPATGCITSRMILRSAP